jgi:hypothetical protein
MPKKKKNLTPKQEKFVALQKRELKKKLNNEKPKTKGQVLKEAGYGEAVQKAPGQVYDNEDIKAELKKYEARIAKAVEKSMDIQLSEMQDPVKAQAAKLSENVAAAKQTFHMHRVLSDQSTSNIAINLPGGLPKELVERLVTERAE